MAISVNINASTVGASIMNAADPSAISWIRVNADNTITYRTAAQTLSDLGAETALTFSTGLTRTVNAITIDSTVVTLTGSQALSNKTGLISQWTNDSGYLTSLAGAVTSVTGSGNIASSGGATPNITFTGVLPTANGGTGVNIASAALVLGTASTTAGQLTLSNATNANTITIQSGVTSSSHTLTLPVANASGVLTNNGSGTLTWAASSSGITVGTTTITSGTDNRILFQDATASDFVTQTANFTMGAVASGYLDVPTGYALAGSKLIYSPNSTSIVIGGSGVTVSGSYNTILSYDFNVNLTGGSNTLLGRLVYRSGGAVGVNNTAIGCRALEFTHATANIAQWSITVGSECGVPQGNSIVIGAGATATATHQGVLGSNNGNGYISDWYFNGVTHTAPYSVVLHACHGSGTNTNAANMTLSGGAATGTGNGGYVKATTSVKRASGTTQQSDTDRNVIPAKYVDITGGAATTFGTLALTTSGTTSGGEVMYTIEANDGTDYQSLTGVLKYDVVNKAGTLTVTYSDVQNGAGACSAGTLTATVTAVVSGTSIQFQANAVSSLSETVLRVSFQVINNFGVATIAPA